MIWTFINLLIAVINWKVLHDVMRARLRKFVLLTAQGSNIIQRRWKLLLNSTLRAMLTLMNFFNSCLKLVVASVC